MNFQSVLIRLWHLKFFILASAVLCAIVAMLATMSMANRYFASATIQLDTRFENATDRYSVGRRQIDTFVRSQAAIIKDISVTGRVVDQLGWTNSYSLAQEYNQSGAQTGVDFRTWLGNSVADRIVLTFEDDSPTFTVGYIGLSREEASTMVDLVRQAYIDFTVERARGDAAKNQRWFDDQLAALRRQMSVLEKRNSDFGLANDVILDANGISQTEMELRGAPYAVIAENQFPTQPAQSIPHPLDGELEEIDAEIARLSTTMGPNHPRLKTLQAERSEMASIIARTTPETVQAPVTPTGPTQQDIEAKYLAKAEVIQTAKRYADELAALEAQFARFSQRRQAFALDSASLRPTASSEGAVVPLGEVYYPRKTFAVAGAAGFGALLASLLGLLFSFTQHRVKSNEDLRHLEMPVLGLASA